MGRTICGTVVLLCLAGCQNRTIVDDNAVLGPPPPRTTLEQEPAAPAQNPEILQASGEAMNKTPLVDALDERIVARVSGQPIFAADVLVPFRPFIETRRHMLSKLPSEQQSIGMKQLDVETTKLLMRTLPDYIDREVVLQSVHRTLQKEQLDGIENEIDNLFGSRVDTIVEAAGMNSRAELEEVLIQPNHELFPRMTLAWRKVMGTNPSPSLAESRESFGKMAMAAEFLRARAQEPSNIDRADMLEYYHAHSDDYDVPLELKWQQIVVSYDGDKEQAAKKVQSILQRLRAGESFDELAKENSSGPTAADGGVRDWIEKGSLVDNEIEGKLFELPKGGVSDVFERGDRFEIVKVMNRRGGFRKTFASMQSSIRNELLANLQQAARQDALDKLRDESDVEVLMEAPQPKAELPPELFRANR